MTHAQKAKQILGSERIRCEIVSLDPTVTRHGCGFGIAYDCLDQPRVAAILKRNGLGYGDTIGKGQP